MSTKWAVGRALVAAMAWVAVAYADSASNGVYGGYVGSDQWFRSMNESAQRRAMMQSLSRGGGHGGCNPLPAGWASVDVSVQFPASYRGYPQWVNSASLVPEGPGVDAFVAKREVPESYTRLALRTGTYSVRSAMCAPSGRRYWVVVDSGTQRVAIGEVALARATHYNQALRAPELNQINTPVASRPSQPTSGGWSLPRSGQGYRPPQVDNGWKPPTTDNSWKPPQTDNNWKPPQSGG